jgi:hypothetical protein
VQFATNSDSVPNCGTPDIEVRTISNLYIRAPDERVRNTDSELHLGRRMSGAKFQTLLPGALGYFIAQKFPMPSASNWPTSRPLY